MTSRMLKNPHWLEAEGYRLKGPTGGVVEHDGVPSAFSLEPSAKDE